MDARAATALYPLPSSETVTHGPQEPDDAYRAFRREPNQVVYRFHQSGARARPLCDVDFPDGGDRARSRVRAHLRRADRVGHGLLYRLWGVLPACRMARRPLEQTQHDGGVLWR